MFGDTNVTNRLPRQTVEGSKTRTCFRDVLGGYLGPRYRLLGTINRVSTSCDTDLEWPELMFGVLHLDFGHTVHCILNSKKRFRRIFTQPQDVIRTPTLFYTMCINKMHQVKLVWSSDSMIQLRNSSISGENCQNMAF